jgi:hypothetical protein
MVMSTSRAASGEAHALRCVGILRSVQVARHTPPLSDKAGKSNGITANRSAATWYSPFPNPVVAESILDRVVNSACHANMDGKSYRPTKLPVSTPLPLIPRSRTGPAQGQAVRPVIGQGGRRRNCISLEVDRDELNADDPAVASPFIVPLRRGKRLVVIARNLGCFSTRCSWRSSRSIRARRPTGRRYYQVDIHRRLSEGTL